MLLRSRRIAVTGDSAPRRAPAPLIRHGGDIHVGPYGGAGVTDPVLGSRVLPYRSNKLSALRMNDLRCGHPGRMSNGRWNGTGATAATESPLSSQSSRRPASRPAVPLCAAVDWVAAGILTPHCLREFP